MIETVATPSRSRPAVRLLLIAALVAGVLLTIGGRPATAKERRPACPQRLLVLAAMPVEIEKLLAATRIDPSQTVELDGRRFYVGQLQGQDVVLAMTYIGTLNAQQTTEAAFAHFRCGRRSGIRGVVFSGVAGGDFIGNVAVPDRWTDDNRQTWYPVDRRMLAVAQRLARRGAVALTRDTPVGDPACACEDPGLVSIARLPHAPKVNVGGQGFTADPFGGRRLPCFPSGGDVFGCEPCRDQQRSPEHVARFATGIAPFLDPDFFQGYFENPPVADEADAATDMESGTVARVAAAHGTPFIAFRAASDGQGDPLGLPGFPFQFFAYRQLAADNAAAVTMAFLQSYPSRG